MEAGFVVSILVLIISLILGYFFWNRNKASSHPPPLSIPSPHLSRQQITPTPQETAMFREMFPNFNKFFEDQEALGYFEIFLERDFCKENLDFVRAAREFRNTNFNTKEDQAASAKRIFNRFLKESSNEEVNLESSIRSVVAADIEGEINTEIFKMAEQNIYALLRHDPFLRFQKDPLWRSMVRTLGPQRLDQKQISTERTSY